MRNGIAILLCLMLLAGCSVKETGMHHQFIRPIPVSVDIRSLKDTILPAEFSVSDISWADSAMALSLFSEDKYDPAEIEKIAVGDTLLFEGDTIIIQQIAYDNGITVNGGLEEGGADLVSDNDGAYRALLMDDHSSYTEICRTSLQLGRDLVVIDCGDNPADPYDTIRCGFKSWCDSLKPYKKYFSCLDTRVEISQGNIIRITRHWIP